MKLLKICTIMMLTIYNVNSTIFHMGYISLQLHINSDTIHLVSYSLDCHMQSFVQTLTWALAESNLHVLSLLPHVALFVFSSRSL